MFAQVHSPENLDSSELDVYLERGWFRMGQTIFTTNFLNFKNQFYSAIWLRVVLDRFQADATQQKLFKRNAAFRTEIKKATITPEKEELYAVYKEAIPFEASSSLNQLLFGTSLHSIYNTYEVNIYDSDKLIAVGFFDIGKNSAMGISSFYDPSYKKHSLGKYVIYLKMNYCKGLGLRYFYPGYFAPGYPFFDYKLTMGRPALEFFQLGSGQWITMDSHTPKDVPLQVMTDRLNDLLGLLARSNVDCRILKYEFFYANQLPDLKGADLFDFPLFIYRPIPEEYSIGPILTYDVRDGKYHWLKCVSIWSPPSPASIPGFYSEHLLKIENDVFTSENPKEMVARLKIPGQG